MALKVKRNTEKEDEKLRKEIEKVTKEKDDKKKDKSSKKKEEKKQPAVQKESWWHGVKSEFKKVRWPSRKEMLKYSIATICFIIFFALFFYLIELVIYLMK